MIQKTTILMLVALLALAGCGGAPRSVGRLVVEREVAGNSDIYVLNADGSGLTRLTDDPGWDGTPRWSPDGTRIAFASERLGLPAIFVMDADGSNLQPLTDGASVSMMPAWSPGGSKIAFASDRSYEVMMQGGRQLVEGGLEIWLMNADGSDVERITGNYEDQAMYPDWAPNGQRLAYMEIADSVRIVAQTLSQPVTASILTEGLEGRAWSPAWSPDGQQIAIMGEVDEVKDIWLIRPDGGEAVNLSNSPSNDGDPAWSPDGQQIVFVSDRDGTNSLYVMDRDGKNVRRLTTDDARYARPQWTAP